MSMTMSLPDIVTDNPWLFGGLAAGVVGLGCVFLIRKWAAGGVCRSQAKLDGKTVIITGANTGIGLETAVDLAKRNARVILACRSIERGKTAAIEVRKRSDNDNVIFIQLDLASLDSVRKFAAKILEEEPRIDILINNAGVTPMGLPERAFTQDGFEISFGINHLGHFLLTNLLLDRIKEAPSARIVNVSSLAHKWGNIDLDNLNSEHSYSAQRTYCTSKLCNIMFTRSLAKRLEGTRVTANSLHPGTVSTELGRNLNTFVKVMLKPFALFLKTPKQGAQTTIYCAVSEEMEGVTGKYLADCKIVKTRNPQAMDNQLAEKLWEVSAKLTNMIA